MSVVNAVTGVFTELSAWIIDAMSSATVLFWDPQTGLTLIGTLAIMSLGIAVSLLVLNLIKNFVRFK